MTTSIAIEVQVGNPPSLMLRQMEGKWNPSDRLVLTLAEPVQSSTAFQLLWSQPTGDLSIKDPSSPDWPFATSLDGPVSLACGSVALK